MIILTCQRVSGVLSKNPSKMESAVVWAHGTLEESLGGIGLDSHSAVMSGLSKSLPSTSTDVIQLDGPMYRTRR